MSRSADRRGEAKGFEQLWGELEQVPEGCRGEIVDGEVVVMPRSNPPHVRASSDLGTLLGGWFRFGIGGPGGWVILDEPRIRFGDEVRVPDLAGWSIERFGANDTGPFLVIPDWICEVLSPGTTIEDRTAKLPLYARHRVGHVWLLDPLEQTLEIYRLHGEGWFLVAAFGADAKVRAAPFDAVELDLTLVWGPKRVIEQR
ncbi:MAG: Uma2 family endonuclease [Deltaproteobacteria bacterium]|nr:Uma2 family endonuclease [Deltaproteobacteria bacterium]